MTLRTFVAKWWWLALAAALAAVLVALVHKKESFSLDSLWGKGRDNAVGGANFAIGPWKGQQYQAAGGGGGGGGGGGSGGDKYQVTYAGRVWDGFAWICPDGSIETGQSNDKACVTSQFHPQMWRWDGSNWGWSCPNGTTPTAESNWDKKCEVGYMGRVSTDSGWSCPAGTTDTGKNWGNSSWHDAQKQCRRTTAYTQRVLTGGKWACPGTSTDTGRNWGQSGGEKQCLWFGPGAVK